MWCADPVQCRLCNHKQISIWESVDGVQRDDLECGNCGQFSCEHDPIAAEDAEAQLVVKELLKKIGMGEDGK